MNTDGFMEFMKARHYMLTGEFRDYAKTKKYIEER